LHVALSTLLFSRSLSSHPIVTLFTPVSTAVALPLSLNFMNFSRFAALWDVALVRSMASGLRIRLKTPAGEAVKSTFPHWLGCTNRIHSRRAGVPQCYFKLSSLCEWGSKFRSRLGRMKQNVSPKIFFTRSGHCLSVLFPS
jgi:hypothetical protein